MTKIDVDRLRCQGHGRCVFHAPELFDFDDDDKAFVQRSPETPAERAEAELALLNCPEDAISLVEAER